MGISSSVLWCLLVTMLVGWLINSLSARGRLGYHEVWIRSPPFLPRVKELLPLCYVNYTSSSSTPQVHLPRIDPTIVPTVLSPESAPPPCTVNRRGGRPLSPLCLSDASWCTPRWDGSPRLPLTTLPRGTPTLRLPSVFLSSSWSVALPDGGTPPGPRAYTRSPPRSQCNIGSPTAPPPCTLLHGPAPLLPSFL